MITHIITDSARALQLSMQNYDGVLGLLLTKGPLPAEGNVLSLQKQSFMPRKIDQ